MTQVWLPAEVIWPTWSSYPSHHMPDREWRGCMPGITKSFATTYVQLHAAAWQSGSLHWPDVTAEHPACLNKKGCWSLLLILVDWASRHNSRTCLWKVPALSTALGVCVVLASGPSDGQGPLVNAWSGQFLIPHHLSTPNTPFRIWHSQKPKALSTALPWLYTSDFRSDCIFEHSCVIK